MLIYSWSVRNQYLTYIMPSNIPERVKVVHYHMGWEDCSVVTGNVEEIWLQMKESTYYPLRWSIML